ncbi:MAG: ATP-binding cassette domain-containing protein [Solirubrobacteraceae bacterium]
MPAEAPLLCVEGVWKGVRRGRRRWSEAQSGVLSDVSFVAGRGDIVAILGGRLVGKSTLLKLAAGIDAPDRGRVILDGRDLASFSGRERSRLLGAEIVWLDRQGPGLDMEVSRFVGWPLILHGHHERTAERLACCALERVGAMGCVGQRWGDISDTEKVLVGLARGFAGSPKLVVIDDLLDCRHGRANEETADLLRSLVEESAFGCAVLMSVSVIESGVFADRLCTLTRKGTLKVLSEPERARGQIIPFPNQAKRRGSWSVGSQ